MEEKVVLERSVAHKLVQDRLGHKVWLYLGMYAGVESQLYIESNFSVAELEELSGAFSQPINGADYGLSGEGSLLELVTQNRLPIQYAISSMIRDVENCLRNYDQWLMDTKAEFSSRIDANLREVVLKHYGVHYKEDASEARDRVDGDYKELQRYLKSFYEQKIEEFARRHDHMVIQTAKTTVSSFFQI